MNFYALIMNFYLVMNLDVILYNIKLSMKQVVKAVEIASQQLRDS